MNKHLRLLTVETIIPILDADFLEEENERYEVQALRDGFARVHPDDEDNLFDSDCNVNSIDVNGYGGGPGGDRRFY